MRQWVAPATPLSMPGVSAGVTTLLFLPGLRPPMLDPVRGLGPTLTRAVRGVVSAKGLGRRVPA